MKSTIRLLLIVGLLVMMLVVGGTALAAEGVPLVDAPKIPERIGYVLNYAMHEWYQNVMKGMRSRAADYGIELEMIDANLDMAKEIAAAEDLIAKEVDVLIITPVDQKGAEPILDMAEKAGIPVVIEGSGVKGMETLVAISDYDAGVKVGKWAGEYVNEHLGGKANVLDITLSALRPTVLRSMGFADGIKSVVDDVKIYQVEGKGLKDEAVRVATDALTADPFVNVIFGINDDSALGGLQAYRAAGLDESELLVIGFGLEGKAGKSALMEGSAYKVSAAMFPEYVGLKSIDQAIKVYNDMPVKLHEVTPTMAMTAEKLPKYYTKKGDDWEANLEAIAQLPTEEKPSKE